MKQVTIFCDGGARGNPGPSAIGIAIYKGRQSADSNAVKDTPIKEVSKFVGNNVTNNQAEYMAVIESLYQAQAMGAESVFVYVDSQLIERQIKREYKVKNEGLKDYYNKAVKLIKAFNDVHILHVRRDKNKVADKLVNEALNAVSC